MSEHESKTVVTATPADAVRILNEALAAEPEAMQALLQRVPCGGGLIEHPTIQVGGWGGDQSTLSVVGLINGIFGCTPEGGGHIAACVDAETGKTLRFVLVDSIKEEGAL